jgi:hypothetical protein
MYGQHIECGPEYLAKRALYISNSAIAVILPPRRIDGLGTVHQGEVDIHDLSWLVLQLRRLAAGTSQVPVQGAIMCIMKLVLVGELGGLKFEVDNFHS